jgi:hypothetical protein
VSLISLDLCNISKPQHFWRNGNVCIKFPNRSGFVWNRGWSPHKVKYVKCTLVQAPRLCTGRTAHRGSRGLALLFLDHGTRRGWGVSVTLRPLFTPGKDPVPIVQEVEWAPGPAWTSAKNLALTGIRSPDRRGRSQSLYRLSYSAVEVQIHFLKLDVPPLAKTWPRHNLKDPHYASSFSSYVLFVGST